MNAKNHTKKWGKNDKKKDKWGKCGEFWKKKNANKVIYTMLAFSTVPRAGVEPARVAPLVFETSASTDSAIWAKKRA